jgi:hypothetical protein
MLSLKPGQFEKSEISVNSLITQIETLLIGDLSGFRQDLWGPVLLTPIRI